MQELEQSGKDAEGMEDGSDAAHDHTDGSEHDHDHADDPSGFCGHSRMHKARKQQFKQLAAICDDFTAHEVHRLNTVGSLMNRVKSIVAPALLNRVLSGVPCPP